MNNYEKHQALVQATHLLITKNYPHSVRLFKRQVGLFYAKRINGGVIDYTPIQIGKKGQADDYGVATCMVRALKPSPLIPVHFELEFKTGDGQLNPDQVIWKDFALSMGWIYLLVRENTDVIRELEREIAKKEMVICIKG